MNEVKSFVLGLPLLGENECHVVMAFARRKYMPTLPKPNLELGRVIITRNDVETPYKLHNKLVPLFNSEWECEVGPIPVEAVGLYMYPYCDTKKTAKNFALKVVESEFRGESLNLQSTLASVMSKSRKKVFVDLDIDTTKPEYLKAIGKFLSENGLVAEYTIKSKTGYHVYLKKCNETAKVLFAGNGREVLAQYEVEVKTDFAMVVPGYGSVKLVDSFETK